MSTYTVIVTCYLSTEPSDGGLEAMKSVLAHDAHGFLMRDQQNKLLMMTMKVSKNSEAEAEQLARTIAANALLDAGYTAHADSSRIQTVEVLNPSAGEWGGADPNVDA